MAYPAGYPSIDWDTAVQALLPDIAANGDGLAFAKILVDPLRRAR